MLEPANANPLLGMIRDVRIVFAQDWPWAFVLALTALVLLSVWFFYRRAARSTPSRALRVLVGLRVFAMLFLLLCLFRPIISFHRMKVAHSQLLFVIDVSRSMSVRDFPNQPNRLERVHAALFRPDTPLARLERSFDPTWFAFDSDGRKLRSKRSLDRLKPDGKATDLTSAVRAALRNRDPEDVAGVALITDGIDNSIHDPVAEIAALKATVFPVAVGRKLIDQPNYKDIRITQIDPRREVALNAVAEIRVYVDAVGYANHVVPVVLYEGDREIDNRPLALDNVRGPQCVILRYRPKTKGEHDLKVVIPPDSAERITENNKVSFPVYVTEPRIKALYIEGVLRQEYRAVRRALQFDPNVELISFVRTAPEGLEFLQQGHIDGVELHDIPTTVEQLQQFDVFILGSVDISVLTAKRLKPETVRKFVERGGGFLAIGGRHAFGPGGYAGTAIEEALPVYMGGRAEGQEKAAFFMRLTQAGDRSPIFAGYAEFFKKDSPKAGMRQLMLLGCSKVARRKPAATVLAVNPNRRNAAGPLIVLAVQPYPRGRTAALTIDSTWRWYRPLKGMGRQSPFVRFWGQLVRWLAGVDPKKRAGAAGLVAYTDKHIYEPGEPVRFMARVTDKEGKATPFARVSLKLTRKSDKQSAVHGLPYIDGTFGDYELELSGLDPSRYEGVVTATLTDPVTKETRSLGQANITFRVSEPNREFEHIDVNETLLDNIADKTGGKRYTLLSIDQLAHEITRRSRKAGVYTEWPSWGAGTLIVPFAAIVLLLTCEWILRKRKNML